MRQPSKKCFPFMGPTTIILAALFIIACGEDEGGLMPTGPIAGMTGAGTTGDGGGTGMMNGMGGTTTPGGGMTTGGGTTPGDGMGGMTTVVPPMDDAGRCFEACLNLLTCDTRGIEECGAAAIAAFASSCQSACLNNAAAINSATATGCGGEPAVLSALGLICQDDTACAEAACPAGDLCQAGQCTPFSCALDSFETEGNDAQDRATPLTFESQSLTQLTLCGEDRDWFSIEIPAGASLRVDLGFQDTQADIDLKAYKEDGAFLASSVTTTDNERLTFVPMDSDRRIWLEIYGFAGASAPGGEQALLSAQYNLYLSTNLPVSICQVTSQCTGDDVCRRELGVCAPPPPCLSDDECGFNDLCDIPSGRCIECYTNENCTNMNAPICNTASNECVSCLANTDCMDMEEPLCQVDLGQCVECLSDTDCIDGICDDGGRCLPNACQDPQEPNDDLMSATVLSFNGGIAEVSSYACSNDDYYVFNAGGGENLLIQTLFSHEMGDIEMEVIDPNGMSARRATSTDNEIIAFPNAVAGQYQIRIYPYQNAINAYTLRIEQNAAGELCNANAQCMSERCDTTVTATCLPDGYCETNRDCGLDEPICDQSTERCKTCTLDPFEPNEDANSAIPVESVNGTLNTCGGPDYFLVQASAGQSIEVAISFLHMTGDLDLKLLNTAMEQVASSTGTADTETITYVAEVGGAYLIHVYGFRDVYNEYTLNVSVR